MPYVPPKSASSSHSSPLASSSKPSIPFPSIPTTTASSSFTTTTDISENAMLTPRPTDAQVSAGTDIGPESGLSSDNPPASSTSNSNSNSIETLSTQLASTNIAEMDGTSGYTPIEQAMSDTELNTSASNASLTSMSTAKSLPSESEVGTPPTSHGTPEVEVVEDRVMRYREGLYAYTRGLYLEAKLSQGRKSGQTNYSQFGSKQSGMEKMAAKKALARRLND